LQRFLLDIALAEYTSLNDQVLTKTKMLYQIYLIYFGALGVFYGYIFNNKIYGLLMLVPWMSLALFFRLYYDQQIMNLIERYVQEQLIPKQLLPLVTAGQAEEPREKPAIMKWTRFYQPKLFPYYKISFFLVFVFLSVGPALWYNASNKPWQNLQICQFTWAPPFPPTEHLIFAILNIGIGVVITCFIWKIDPWRYPIQMP